MGGKSFWKAVKGIQKRFTNAQDLQKIIDDKIPVIIDGFNILTIMQILWNSSNKITFVHYHNNDEETKKILFEIISGLISLSAINLLILNFSIIKV